MTAQPAPAVCECCAELGPCECAATTHPRCGRCSRHCDCQYTIVHFCDCPKCDALRSPKGLGRCSCRLVTVDDSDPNVGYVGERVACATHGMCAAD